MTNRKRRFRRGKLILIPFHIILMTMSVFRISAMHLNPNYGKGARWMYGDVHEDSVQLDKQLIEDIDRILTYVGCKDMLEINGKLDIHKAIVRVSGGLEEQGMEWTLDRTVRCIKTRGYYLDGDSQLAGSPISMDDEEEEITIDFRNYNPDFVDVDAGEAPRMTMEDLTLDILVHLSEYYTIYYSYIENDMNLSFRIGYKSDKGGIKVSTNMSDKTMEKVVDTGKYLCVPGNTIRTDTNIVTVPANAITLLGVWNPYKNDENYTVLSADISYPDTGIYSIEAKVYKEARNRFIISMNSVMLSDLGCMVILAMLMLVSGHTTDGNAEARLFPIDDIHTKSCLILQTAATVTLIYIGRYVEIRLFSLFTPSEQWNYWNKMVKLVIMYGNVVLYGFDLLRRYKARTLWGSSLAEWALEASRDYVGRASYIVETGFCCLLFLGFNAGILWGLTFLSLYKGNKLSYQIMSYVLVMLYLGLNEWIYHLLFRKSAQRDALDMTANSIFQGDTSYQIDTTRLSGKKRQMVEHLNGISSGLDPAIQEQVESERLRVSLIINVSHDIKTPLTSIINYVDLLKREKIQDPKIAAYLEVLNQKSQGLKTLTENLVGASETSPGNMKLDISDIDLVELAQQINGKFEERFALRRPELISSIPGEVLIIQADGRHLWCVLESLHTNAAKYAMEHNRVCMDVLGEDGKAISTVKNVSESLLNISPGEPTERFVGGDVSRATERSGLGLSISKDLTRLQGGEFQVVIDEDLFKAVMSFPVKRVGFKAERTVGEPGDMSQDFGHEEDIVA